VIRLAILAALAWVILAIVGRRMETEARRASDDNR
jgi:hypothetical protein